MKYFLILIISTALFFSCSSNSSTEGTEQHREVINPDSIPAAPTPDTVKPVEELNASKTDTPVAKPVQQAKKRNGQTRGQVSHFFKKTGCTSVVIISKVKVDDEIILIPKDALSKEIDKDGLIIYFNYHMLKIPNPPGCVKGIPAEITDAEAE